MKASPQSLRTLNNECLSSPSLGVALGARSKPSQTSLRHNDTNEKLSRNTIYLGFPSNPRITRCARISWGIKELKVCFGETVDHMILLLSQSRVILLLERAESSFEAFAEMVEKSWSHLLLKKKTKLIQVNAQIFSLRNCPENSDYSTGVRHFDVSNILTWGLTQYPNLYRFIWIISNIGLGTTSDVLTCLTSSRIVRPKYATLVRGTIHGGIETLFSHRCGWYLTLFCSMISTQDPRSISS